MVRVGVVSLVVWSPVEPESSLNVVIEGAAGAEASSVYGWLAIALSPPNESSTLNWIAWVPERSVAVSQTMEVPVALAVMSTQVVPPSTEARRISPEPVSTGWLKVAVMVCAATFVTKSPAAPLSAEIWMLLIVVAGPEVSIVMSWLSVPPTLPATSTTRAW